MRVLGIDCGTERTGWGVIESDGRDHRVLAHGVIRTAVRRALGARACWRSPRGLREVIRRSIAPEAAAVEEVFYFASTSRPR